MVIVVSHRGSGSKDGSGVVNIMTEAVKVDLVSAS